MDYNNSLQNNENNASYSNNLQSPQSFQTEQFSSNALHNTFNYINYSSMNNDIVPTSYTQQQQPMFSFASDENTTTGTTQLLPHAPAAPYDSYNISSPLSSLNMIYNSSQSHSEVFRFEIPGFKIIIIPNSSPHSSLYANLDNLDIQNQSQQVFTSMSLSIIRKFNFSKIQINRLPISTIFIANSLMCAICGILMTGYFY